MTDRRYSEDEVAEIFQRAASAETTGERPRLHGEGRTLEELQGIGREVGIPSDLITRAARSLDRDAPAPSQTYLGLPVRVGRTVEFERRLTDAEWERLVVDLRETFDARGRVRQEGAFRQWTNGNLQALLEPTETGQRLRLRTEKGDARSLVNGGLALLGIAAAVLLAALLFGEPGSERFAGALLLSMLGAGLIAAGGLRVPGWAALRGRQMDEVAARTALMVSSEPPDRTRDQDRS